VLPGAFAVFGLDELELVAQYLADGFADDARVIRHQHPDFIDRNRGYFGFHFHVLTHSRNGPIARILAIAQDSGLLIKHSAGIWHIQSTEWPRIFRGKGDFSPLIQRRR